MDLRKGHQHTNTCFRGGLQVASMGPATSCTEHKGRSLHFLPEESRGLLDSAERFSPRPCAGQPLRRADQAAHHVVDRRSASWRECDVRGQLAPRQRVQRRLRIQEDEVIPLRSSAFNAGVHPVATAELLGVPQFDDAGLGVGRRPFAERNSNPMPPGRLGTAIPACSPNPSVWPDLFHREGAQCITCIAIPQLSVAALAGRGSEGPSYDPHRVEPADALDLGSSTSRYGRLTRPSRTRHQIGSISRFEEPRSSGAKEQGHTQGHTPSSCSGVLRPSGIGVADEGPRCEPEESRPWRRSPAILATPRPLLARLERPRGDHTDGQI